MLTEASTTTNWSCLRDPQPRSLPHQPSRLCSDILAFLCISQESARVLISLQNGVDLGYYIRSNYFVDRLSDKRVEAAKARW